MFYAVTVYSCNEIPFRRNIHAAIIYVALDYNLSVKTCDNYASGAGNRRRDVVSVNDDIPAYFTCHVAY